MTVRLNTLGRLQVFRGSEELTSYSLRGTRCALLLYIALEGRTTRDAAMAVVWPEISQQKDPLPTADEFKDVQAKRDMLDESPGGD